VPRRGIPMIVREARKGPEVDKPKQVVLYSASGMAKLVRRLRELKSCQRRSRLTPASMAGRRNSERSS
jgi:hypothetical protein